MIYVHPEDDALNGLQGVEVPSDLATGVVYRIGRCLGAGGMGLAFLASRLAPDGWCPVVFKVVRPSFARQSPHARLVVQKEAVALGRLNERVPPTPFVVRLIDTGTISVVQGEEPLDLSWLAVEYVHGGPEGTTLTERLKFSVHQTGFAFGTKRAASAVMCIIRGMIAVHDVGVVHRDLKPDNVLACGFGDEEIFKIADFGAARPSGLIGTFRGELFGTPGYAAPELQASNPTEVGPWTDVFSLVPTLYFLLTGEEYFPAQTPWDHIRRVGNPTRRSVLDAATLSPDVREREQACRAIDAEFKRASAVDRAVRHQSVDALGAAVLRWLSVDSRRTHVDSRRLGDLGDARPGSAWTWTVRHRASRATRIHNVAWDSDGRCLAAADAGVLFWDGTTWHDALLDDLGDGNVVRFVHRAGPGRWIVGGDGATVAECTVEGVSDLRRGADATLSYRMFGGDLNDLGVLVGCTDAGPPTLFAVAGGWWLKPLPLLGVSAVSGLARVDRATWLLVGEAGRGEGFAAMYSPLEWEVARLHTPGAGPFRACAAAWALRAGVAIATDGNVVWCEGSSVSKERIEGGPISTAAIDPSGQAWAGGTGCLWLRDATGGRPTLWRRVWESTEAVSPIVSIFASIGLVIAVNADGDVLEGRLSAPVGQGGTVFV